MDREVDYHLFDNGAIATCRHCNHWNNHHMEGNRCVVFYGLSYGDECGCPKWESKDNLFYLEMKAEEKNRG